MNLLKPCFFALLVVIAVSGCTQTTYRYTPPVTDAGLDCVSNCQILKNDCRNHEEEKARIAYRRCSREAVITYDHCLEDAQMEYRTCRQDATKEHAQCLKITRDPKACPKTECHKRACHKETCFDNNGNFSRCERQFRECYSQCGGRVDIIEE